MNEKIIIVDIDGTIANIEHRLHHIKGEKKDWKAFYEDCDKDEPIKEIIDILEEFTSNRDYKIVFCTGRKEYVRKKTIDWLWSGVWDLCCYHEKEDFMDTEFEKNKRLLMRGVEDNRPDSEVKPELLKDAGIKKEDVAFILEDRSSMVKKWRELGFTCLQVADGDY